MNGNDVVAGGAIVRALLSAGLAIAVIVATGAPQGSDTDSGWQFKAVQQYIDGSSPSFNTLVGPDPEDLSRNLTRWISWWAPGSGLLVWSLMRLHLTLGGAIRVIAIVCFLAGSVGWSVWIDRFVLPGWVKALLSMSIPWFYYAHHNALFFYGAEALLFAAVPWALLLAVECWDCVSRARGSVLRASVTGLSLGLLYVLKYSGVFVSIGVLTYIVLRAVRPQCGPGGDGLCFKWFQRAGVCAVACLLPIVFLSLVNQLHAGHMNLVAASASFRLRWAAWLFAVSSPALAAASAEAPLRHVLAQLSLPGGVELWLALAGFPGGAVLLFLILRRGASHRHALMSCCVLGASLTCAVVVWTISDGVSYESRHIAGASIAVLPYALERAWGLRTSSRRLQMLLAVCGICYIVLPWSYGVVSVVAKAARQARQNSGPSRVYNPLLARNDVTYARSMLVEGFDPRSDLWYVTHPVAGLDLPGRMLIRRADSTPIEKLREETFRTSRPVRVRLVLPAGLENDGKADVIRRSFPGAVEWASCPTDGATRCWVAWVGTSAGLTRSGKESSAWLAAGGSAATDE